MKIAILGASPESLFFLEYFASIDAHVTLWGDKNPLELAAFSKKLDSDIDWDSILENIRNKIFYRSEKIYRVQKSFLNYDEKTIEHRMKDMFRIVFQKNDLEFYEDYDFIIHSQSLSDQDFYLGGSSPALQELSLRGDKKNIFYNYECLDNAPSDEDESIAIFGGNQLLSQLTPIVNNWLQKNKKRKMILCNYHHQNLASHLLELQMYYHQKLENEVKKFEQDRSLPEPFVQVEALTGYELTGIDFLEDRNRLYLTLEIPSFRRKIFEKSHGSKDLMSFAVDKVYGLFPYLTALKNLPSFVLENEPGHYKIKNRTIYAKDDLTDEAEKIKNDMGQYFSRA